MKMKTTARLLLVATMVGAIPVGASPLDQIIESGVPIVGGINKLVEDSKKMPVDYIGQIGNQQVKELVAKGLYGSTLILKDSNLSDLSEVGKIGGVQFLYIENMPNLKDLSFLNQMDTVIKLTLDNVDAVTDLSPVVRMSGLESLHLKNLNIHSNQIVNLGGTNLKELDIEYCPNITHVGFLNSTRLEHLGLVEVPVTDLSAVLGRKEEKIFHPVTQLYVTYTGNRSLGSLGLVKTNVSNINFVSGLPNLSFVVLQGNKITDKSPVQNHPNKPTLIWSQN